MIELLVVVAIIAILSALALPNLQQAQARARLARARADLRTAATAIETYRLDRNAYPTMLESGFSGGVPPLAGSDLKWWYLPDVLSTPVAYLADAHLCCPFGGDVDRREDFPDPIWRRYSYENIAELEAKAADFPVLTYKYGPDKRASERVGHWRLLSIGPDRAWNPMIPYDPSNGTLSTGNLIRTQRDPGGRRPGGATPPSY